MTSYVEKQAGMDLPPGLPSRLLYGYRAVCDAHEAEVNDPSGLIASWMGSQLRSTWIDAKLDATEHDLIAHEGEG